MTDITYRVEGDYLIPNLSLDDEIGDSPEEMIGRYGMMRESYLREHQHGTYTAMLLVKTYVSSAGDCVSNKASSGRQDIYA